jgi:GT2 family glycosyltransferase
LSLTKESAARLPVQNSPTYVPPEIGSRLARAIMRVSELERASGESDSRLAEVREELQRIYASRGWKALTLYYRLRNFLFPRGSFRRALVARLMKALKRLKPAIKSTAPAPDPEATAVESAVPDQQPQPMGFLQGSYLRWIETHEPVQAELARQRQTGFASQPRISLVVMVDEPGTNLPALLESVCAQTYPGWELCLVVREDQVAWLSGVLRQGGLDLGRCRIVGRPRGEPFAAGCNAALAAATGDYLALVGAEDTLAPFALFEIVQAINQNAGADFLYSDEDCLSTCGTTRSNPCFKPQWSPDTLRGHNYIGTLAVLSRRLIEQAGGFRDGFSGAEVYDLILRTTEQARAIVQVSRVLYHRRKGATPPEGAGAKRALQEHLARLHLPGEVKDGLQPGTYQVHLALPSRPLVSIIIASKDHADMLARCLDSIEKSTYRRYQIIIVENGSREQETFAYYRTLEGRPEVKVLRWQQPFNYAAINNYGVSQSAGEVLLFLNNDTQVINPDWLERMLEHGLRPGVGAVGAMLYYPDDTVQHGGMVLPKSEGPVHLHRFALRHSPGYCNRLVTLQNVSAVTGACLLMRREVFDEVGGLDERFTLLYNDVDLCLQVRRKGYLVVWTPFAQLYHFESVSRGYEGWVKEEGLLFAQKWPEYLHQGDPYFNPNLKLDGPAGGLLI